LISRPRACLLIQASLRAAQGLSPIREGAHIWRLWVFGKYRVAAGPGMIGEKTMKLNATPMERFQGWFVRAIEKLDELPEGDGAFAALMIILPLYERYVVAKLKLAGKAAGDAEKQAEMSSDLGLKDGQRSTFWAIFRVGFTHQGMGKAGSTMWAVSHTYGELPEFRKVNGQDWVCLDPWKFARRILKKYTDDPRLITASESFPLADVFAL
jgi:hypothetical protein